MRPPFRTSLALFVLVVFATLNRCTCDVNVKPSATQSGNISLVINGLNALANSSGAQYVSVTFSGSVGKTSEGSGNSSFTVTQKFEIDPSGNINPGTTLSRVNLQPGDWTVTAQVNSWNASCTGPITKDKKTTFTFTYNTNGCAVQ